jgi:hypothetical protein
VQIGQWIGQACYGECPGPRRRVHMVWLFTRTYRTLVLSLLHRSLMSTFFVIACDV